MSAGNPGAPEAERTADAAVRALYHELLASWNQRSAAGMAALFAEAGNLVGFDGSQLDGRAAIAAHLRQIFADHTPPPFVAQVREVRFLTPEVALLRGVAGMVPPGQHDLNTDLNAIQTVIATHRDGHWQIELFQNTPAAFHGRPELRQALTDELRALLT
jgi:uncharacterized protein (TIGR02246 family)